MEQIQYIYNDLRDTNEIAIVEKYGNNAKQYTAGLTSKKTSFYSFLYLKLFLMNFSLKLL